MPMSTVLILCQYQVHQYVPCVLYTISVFVHVERVSRVLKMKLACRKDDHARCHRVQLWGNVSVSTNG